jgi:ribonuclease-3
MQLKREIWAALVAACFYSHGFGRQGGTKMDAIEKALGYAFLDKSLLEHALTHSSYANENRGRSQSSNERLEFLGDSVLGMLVAEYLYRAHPKLPEGELTRLRANLVCEQSLVLVAQKWNLGAHLKLGRGEESGGGRRRPSILADAVEAVLAAVYLDGGLAEASRIIHAFVLDNEAHDVIRDYKTALQELVQGESKQALVYHLQGEHGPDHAKIFSVEVCIDGVFAGEGEGRSKKEAEQAAARAAIEHYGKQTRL